MVTAAVISTVRRNTGHLVCECDPFFPLCRSSPCPEDGNIRGINLCTIADAQVFTSGKYC